MLGRTRTVAHGATNLIRRFLADRDGATAIEYAFIAAGIGLVIAASTREVGDAVAQIFVDAEAGLQ